jgi:hypothetical protein
MRLIKSEGKISRADLVNECSRIVSIEPTAEDKIKIKQEEEEIMKKLNSQLQQEDKE